MATQILGFVILVADLLNSWIYMIFFLYSSKKKLWEDLFELHKQSVLYSFEIKLRVGMVVLSQPFYFFSFLSNKEHYLHDRNQTVLLVFLLVMTDIRCIILTAWEYWSTEKKTHKMTIKEPI